MDIFNLFMVAVLILLTAFFVAAEFSIIRVRITRIDQLVAEGNRNAVAAKKVITNLDGSLSACQLGITITALGLGWLGEPTVEHLLHPLFVNLELSAALAKTISFIIAFASITFLHVVLGELAPKTIAIQKAESVSLLLSRPLLFFYQIMYPFIWALNGSAQLFVKLFGFQAASEHEMAHSEEELRSILSESYKSGEINKSEFSYVNNVFEFDNRLAKEIMVPRTEIVTLQAGQALDEAFETIIQEQFTRYPVVGEDKDEILGMINSKELFHGVMKGKQAVPLEEYTRPILSVFENIPIQELLTKMQKKRAHMAILMDEYGGTSGLVTIEDILEELVGEIRDEFDQDESPMIINVNAKTRMLDGKVLIEDVNDLYALDIDETDLDTIGGWMLSMNSDIQKGDVVRHEKYEFKVVGMDGHQIKKIQVREMEEQPSEVN
ncbi:Hemolysin, contains CBS domains [Fictibacillus solisalsi]|uniref:Hemolysin, contains CBS domains n=1 Tax=Fictibacillus solisalsi TaxID=459525 RepID=A0A1G9ZTV4_9BACL|nr:hemolysin family protein [Fictibacillus solisalsi]SDN24545.1 Hemolysin, contains CBS domains [Fictibacillus solisalsi]